MRLRKRRETRHDFKHYMRTWEAMEETVTMKAHVNIYETIMRSIADGLDVNVNGLRFRSERLIPSWWSTLSRSLSGMVHESREGCSPPQFLPVFWFLVQLIVEAPATHSTTRELHPSFAAMMDWILSNCHLNKSVHTYTAFVRYLSVMRKYTTISYYKCQIIKTKEKGVL